jgi:3-methyladenine DNA glycosylase/8-oxoguanine DNA glycosylase
MPGLLERIDALLASFPAQGEPRALRRVEHTLTDGYAHALALEGERLRIERRLEAAGDSDEWNEEISALRSRMAEIDRDLSHLRGRLGVLNHRARELRAALAAG